MLKTNANQNDTTHTSSRVSSAYETARALLLDQRVEGHWVGELSCSALSTATAISAMSFYVQAVDDADHSQIEWQIAAGLAWLGPQQNADGGWGDTDLSYSNISTTMLVIAAIHASGQKDAFAETLQAAEAYVESKGGVEGIRKRYGKDKTFAVPILANCAMAGLVPWSEVSALPFEAACVPQRFYHLMQMPVVSYAIPALVAIGQVKFEKDPPRNPIMRLIRRNCIERSLNVLLKMQPATGGYLEATPLTSFVTMALIKAGRADHPVVKNGIRFIRDSFRAVENKLGETTTPENSKPVASEVTSTGAWPIDTNLAAWTTTLSVNAVCDSGNENLTEPSWQKCLDWILQCQYQEVHPFTGAAPGGWGWSDLSGAVPDADDTPGALLAIKHFYDHEFAGGANIDAQQQASRKKILAAAELGVKWLVNLQNRDSGWPTFCRGWGKLPFDRSGTDITAHVLRALIAWQTELQAYSGDTRLYNKIVRAIDSGFRYIEKHQNADGSWIALWFGNQDQPDEVNPYYGTAKVLMAYRDVGRFDTKTAKIGLNWVLENQNLDGGWGGIQTGQSVISSVEETALCTEVLIDASNRDAKFLEAANRGVDWLCDAVEAGTIDRVSPIGFYFAKLWYHEKLYPLIFATSALGRANEPPT